MHNSGIYKTVAIVTVFSVVERFFGFLYRIFLSRSIGAEGLGVYQIALTVFAMLLTLTSSGIPITVSRLMMKYKAAKDGKAEIKVISAGILLSLFASVPLVAVFLLFQDAFSFLFADARCLEIFTIILPSLIFTSIYAVIRGVFWGQKTFKTYSIIELLEELCMIVLGVILVLTATDGFDGVRRAAYAVAFSYLFSFAAASIVFFVRRGKLTNPQEQLKTLLFASAPVTAMRASTSLINSLIAFLLPLRLAATGLSAAEAMREYGLMSGMAIPLLFVPATVIGSMALVLVPELSENLYKGNKERLRNNIRKAIKFSALVSALIIPLYLSLGEVLCAFLYDNAKSGVYLARSAVVMLPMAISMITTSMLNSLGIEKTTLAYYLAGAILMIASVLFLPALIGTNALIVGYGLSFTLTAALNMKKINKIAGKTQSGKFLLLAAIFTVPSSLLGLLIKRLLLTATGNLITLIVTGTVIVLFNCALYPLFDVVDIAPFVKRTKTGRRHVDDKVT